MARHLSRLSPLVRWQYLRFGLVIPALPLALWACNSHPLQEPLPDPQQQTDFSILVSPEREVDILFLVDNSPSMDPKQTALAKNFPRMIDVLNTLEGGLPDVHIGVVSSDMGAGQEGIGGNCNVPLGDRGLLWGNDKTPGARATVAPGSQWAAAANPPITDGCGLADGARWISDVQKPNGQVGRDTNYSGRPIADVFSCLAKAVGVVGCGYEHQLQAVRLALNPQKIGCDSSGNNCTDVNMGNLGFIRPKAYLAIVLITDEDDCSADPDDGKNNGMFLEKPRDANGVTTETASMRCAARGHVCKGQPIPDYTDPAVGYTGSGFSTNLSDCAPKDQVDITKPDPAWLPLIRVQDMINSVAGVTVMVKDKNGQDVAVTKRPEQILVSGIFGWPTDPNDPNDTLPNTVQTSNQYQIGKDATSIKGQENLWDYMPICKIPSSTAGDGNIYKAYAGLRLKQFVDGFKKGKDRNVFSICKEDFSDAMTQIANAIVKALQPGCVLYPLIDTNPSTAVVEPECQVLDKLSCAPAGQGDCLATGYQEKPLKECMLNGSPLDPANPQIKSVTDDNRPCWYFWYDNDPVKGCKDIGYAGQRISALRKGDVPAPPGTVLAMQCLTCITTDTCNK